MTYALCARPDMRALVVEDDPGIAEGIQLTINAVATALRNSG